MRMQMPCSLVGVDVRGARQRVQPGLSCQVLPCDSSTETQCSQWALLDQSLWCRSYEERD